MTIFKHVFAATFYSILFVNALIMTVQYFLGLNNIASRFFDIFEDVNFAGLL